MRKLNSFTVRCITAGVLVCSPVLVATSASADSGKVGRSTDTLIAQLRTDLKSFDKMTSEEQGRVLAASTLDHVVTVESTTDSASRQQAIATTAAGDACYSKRFTQYGQSAAGNNLWAAYTEGTWCGNRVQTNSSRRDTIGGTTLWPGWSYEGVLDSGNQINQSTYYYGAGGSVTSATARIWGKVGFKYGIGGIIQNKQPCTRINGFGNGGYVFDYKCSFLD